MASALFRSMFAADVASAARRFGYGRIDPALVVAQAVLETGGFTSAIWRESSNAFGLKEPRKRPTLAVGTARGHAVFLSWPDSVDDYFMRQRYFGVPNDPAQYVAETVASGYATAPNYAAAWLALYGQRAGMVGGAVFVAPLVAFGALSLVHGSAQ